ncbi:MAG: hypothetical protein HC892_02660 [Saprospiraceae bacterium]|nr:hypothetical protein [Saprospiraceae bacterium]
MLHQRKVPIQISSDTHHPDDITKGFEVVSEQLQRIGYRTQRVLLDGIWQDVPLKIQANLVRFFKIIIRLFLLF